VGVLVIARDNFFTFWPLVLGIVSSDIDARNGAQLLRRALITAGPVGLSSEIDHGTRGSSAG